MINLLFESCSGNVAVVSAKKFLLQPMCADTCSKLQTVGVCANSACTHRTADTTFSRSVTPANYGFKMSKSCYRIQTDCFKSLNNKLITGVICAPYNYLPVKHHALSLTFLFIIILFLCLFLSQTLGES